VASTGSAGRRICRIRFFVTVDSTCGSNRHPIRQKSLGRRAQDLLKHVEKVLTNRCCDLTACC
jgi:hypothetical protein